ncbi:hypothetical protein KSZ_73490 [Dictyobacter formicarum]|uniref:Uncharacterized protein n=1 Tax=Dictyobacter formicarum TaxID=2778368 RepID=A0ABQ3VVD8_9CHLR|nr:hypothetical protein KSZ_73490 [Dictyobacter formicarum]
MLCANISNGAIVADKAADEQVVVDKVERKVVAAVDKVERKVVAAVDRAGRKVAAVVDRAGRKIVAGRKAVQDTGVAHRVVQGIEVVRKGSGYYCT